MTLNPPAAGELEPIEKASIDELRALQLERLKWSVRHAYENVPHYRKAFDEKGVHPDDLKTLEDLAKFPFTSKHDLRDNYPFGMFAVPMNKVARVHASSGTTGKPTVVGYTLKDIDTWANVVARSIRASGGRPGDMVHVSYGYGLFTGGLGAHYGAERLGCTVVPMSGGQTEKQIQVIQDFKPNIIMVTPSYMLTILDEMEAQGIDPKSTSLRIGIFGAEPWTPAMRTAVEARAGIDAVDIYGLSEVMGPGVANECVETKDGPTIWEDHFYPEIINPDTGEVVADGEEGELVVRGPGVTPGYWNDPETTAVALRDGWLHSGDLGRADEDGRVQFVDRLKDLIISGGINISPVELEIAIGAIDGVQEVAVIAAHDDRFGETPAAIVTASPDVDEKAVIEHCEKVLADFKVPRYVVIRQDPLPRLPSGKLAKTVIRDEYKDVDTRFDKVR